MWKIRRGDVNVSGALADFAQIWLPDGWVKDSGTPMVLLALGGGDDSSVIAASAQIDTLARAVTDAGYGMATSLYGGSGLFGNPTARAQVGVVADHLQTDDDGFGHTLIGAGKLVLVGFSMGAVTTLNWAGNLATPTSRVKGFVGVNPLLDLNVTVPAIQSAVAAAYPSSVTNATDDPKTMAQAGKFSGIACRVAWSSDDTTLAHSTMAPFVAAVGATEIALGAAGHQWTNLALPVVTDAVIAACKS